MSQLVCPPEDQIAGYVLGVLEEEDASKVAKHLEECSPCRSKAELYESRSDPLLELVRQQIASPYVDEAECHRAVARLLSEELFSPVVGGSAGQASPAKDTLETPVSPLPQTLGDYVLLEPLGGSQGQVYKAFHTALERMVVVKMLSVHLLRDAAAVERFCREIKLIGRLDHPNIVRALDARQQDGKRFLVMELVEGCDLAKILARYGPLPIPEACEIARQAAVGLQYIYEHGLVHRDIKPANLMLSQQGQVKILDLGLGRFHKPPSSADEEMTQPGMAVGTVDYMAPEQITSSRDVDIRADIYSLGCTLYKLLSGRAPFDLPECRTAWDKVHAHLRRPVLSLRDLRPETPIKLAEIIHRMLAKDPKERFQTPDQVVSALKPFAAGARLESLWTTESRENASSVCPVRPTSSPLAQTLWSGSLVWFWELLGAAGVLLILWATLFWGPKGWEILRGLWAGQAPLLEVAQPSADPEAPLAFQQERLPSGFEKFASSSPPLSKTLESSSQQSSGSGKFTTASPSQGPKSVPAGKSSASGEQNPSGKPAVSSKEPLSSTPPSEGYIVRMESHPSETIYYGPPAGPDQGGEKIQLTIASNREGYLYVLVQHSDGRILCLFPNAYQTDNHLGVQQPVVIPESSSGYEVRAGPPYGEVVIWALVSAERLKPTQFGVASLTDRLFTEVDGEAVTRILAWIRRNPQSGGQTQLKILTQAGPRKSSDSNPQFKSSSSSLFLPASGDTSPSSNRSPTGPAGSSPASPAPFSPPDQSPPVRKPPSEPSFFPVEDQSPQIAEVLKETREKFFCCGKTLGPGNRQLFWE